MGNTFDVVLVAPFALRAGADRDRIVEGMSSLGFVMVRTEDRHRDGDDRLWVITNRKLNFYEDQKFGIDGLRDLVLALPWPRPSTKKDPAVWVLQVLWADDHTLEDDSWGGRISPYAWQTEQWEVR